MDDTIFENNNAWMWLVLFLLCFSNNGNPPDLNDLQNIGDKARDLCEELNVKELSFEELRGAANKMYEKLHKET